MSVEAQRTRRSLPRLVAAVQRRGFLVALAALLFCGSYWHQPLQGTAQQVPRDLIVATVMFVMALTLETSQIEAALRRPQAAILASLVNMGLLPVLAWGASRPLPADLANGVLIAACVPCTLASAAIWTRRAGGNDAIALLVTLITNLACCVATPAWLWLLAGKASLTQSFGDMAGKLALLVAAPIVAAQVLRRTTHLGAWASRHKFALGIYAQSGILAIVLVGAVHCGERLADLSSATLSLAIGIAASIATVGLLHLLAWAAGLAAARQARLPRADAIAVAFAGSQKTLMVGLAIAVEWGGLAVLPMMAFHAIQLLVDTMLADWMRQRSPEPSHREGQTADQQNPRQT